MTYIAHMTHISYMTYITYMIYINQSCIKCVSYKDIHLIKFEHKKFNFMKYLLIIY